MTVAPEVPPRATRRLGRWAVNTAIVLITLFCLAWLAPSLFGFSRYVITGGSMTGAIDKGSVAFEKPVAVADLRVGDVITYLPPAASGVSTLVTHRIAKIEPAAGGGLLFTTRGDANAQDDPWHFELLDEQQPVVQFSVPHAGWIFIALADRTTRMLAIGVPAALIALIALGQLISALRGSAEQPEPTTNAAPRRRFTVPAQRTAPGTPADGDKARSPELV